MLTDKNRSHGFKKREKKEVNCGIEEVKIQIMTKLARAKIDITDRMPETIEEWGTLIAKSEISKKKSL